MMNLELSREQQEILEKEVNPIVKYAGALAIKSSEDSLSAQRVLKEIKIKFNKIHEKFDPPVRAAHTAWKAAKDLYNFFTEPFTQAEGIIKGKVVSFEREEERKREEDSRIAEAKRQKEERERKEELEARAVKAEERGHTEKADALREQAASTVEAPVFTPPEPVKAQGTVFKKIWKAEVLDLASLCQSIADGRAPLGLIQVNQSAINAFAKGVKNTMPVPGLRFYEDTDMAIRTK